MIFRTLSVLSAAVAISLVASTVSRAESVMTHHIRDEVRSGAEQPNGQLPANQAMSLDIVLPLSNPDGLTAFLADVYNPASPNFHHYVTPDQFIAQFGPTQDDYDQVVSYAKQNGLTVTGGTLSSMDVQVKGPVAAVERAFNVRMNTYARSNGEGNYFGPDREPSTAIPVKIWAVSGLNNSSIPHALYKKRGEFAAAHGVTPESLVKHVTTGSGPQGSFLGSDMRAAYYGGTALTGKGQNLGLFEFLGTDLADLTTYYKQAGQTNNVPITLVSTDGSSTSCTDNRAGRNCDDGEQSLDMTQALGMAPGLASLTMYVGNTDTAIIGAMVSHNPLPTVIGCSWGWSPVDPKTLDPLFQRMAAQGQSFFVASGDNSTWKKSGAAEAWPADDANIISVGGTDLVTAKGGGAWASETAWVDSGGGTSPDKIAIPAYQKLAGVINSTNRGSTTLRNGPDIAANANFTFFTCNDQQACQANEFGGTSFAAPMWAAYIALVNEQLASQGKGPIGFLNPTIYAQNVTSAYATGFHDITSGKSGSFSAETGFDLVTGWGSPKPGLINELAPAP